ncbi:MAG: hypothetical protein ABSH01_27360 [Terriglobia bacterium]|jgi:hypothetical protein
MKNLVLTFLLALLVVLTCVSIRRMVGGTPFAGQKPALVAIGGDPVPPFPPPPPKPTN